ncbi:hypothetical protein D7V80_29315 [Corallococcus sp. CA054B]|uniref:hypothetical protein n=1 Tax=Corallococcus sp. CA054B TaxID=2316734 RepID=UPI000EA2943E|nr:hypothetical protein [Corallococcus sp. CA054B]RKG63786.1 hypothetical protein D7V80_29315 [Corallococcus sp. CA054B]
MRVNATSATREFVQRVWSAPESEKSPLAEVQAATGVPPFAAPRTVAVSDTALPTVRSPGDATSEVTTGTSEAGWGDWSNR